MEWAITAVFFVLSVVFLLGKGAFLIAGYNTASKKEKARYNEKRLCRVMGAGMGILTVLVGLCAVFQDDPPAWLGVAVPAGIFLVIVGLLILSNTVCLVKNPEHPEEIPAEKKKKLGTGIVTTVIIAVFCIGTGALLLTGDVKIEVNEGSVGIEASYWGDYEVALDEIEEISYEENLNLGRRTGGLGSMRLLEGHFANEQFGNYILYAYVRCKSYVVLQTSGGVVVLNQETPEETKELYERIQNAVLEERNQ